MKENIKEVDQLFAEWDRPDSPGVALAVARNGSVIYKRGYGIANLEYSISITPTTVFDIASVSKQFAAISIAMLAEAGKISLDNDIHEYLPEVPDFGKTITVRNLLNHTSGIRDWVQSLRIAGWRMDDIISFEHIMKMVSRQKKLNYNPGDEYVYSNTNYNLLAEIVARISEQDFCQYTDEKIFKPLGMANTHFHGDHEVIVKNRACSYYPSEDGTYKNCINNLMALGSSSLYSTAEDLAKWIINFDEPRIGSASIIKQMRQQGILNNGEKIKYALGLSINEYGGLITADHGGSWAGFRSHLLHFPDQKFGVIILSNLSSVNTVSLARQVANIYLADQLVLEERKATPKEEQDRPSPVQLSPEQLEEFIGDYYNDELDTTYSIAVGNGQLIAKHRRHSDIPLACFGDHFTDRQWLLSDIRFERDDNNQVIGFTLTGGRVRHLLFEKQI